jgi:hypothetical protein
LRLTESVPEAGLCLFYNASRQHRYIYMTAVRPETQAEAVEALLEGEW